jgi:hypothetical protein
MPRRASRLTKCHPIEGTPVEDDELIAPGAMAPINRSLSRVQAAVCLDKHVDGVPACSQPIDRSPRLPETEPKQDIAGADLDMPVVRHIRNRKPGISGKVR